MTGIRISQRGAISPWLLVALFGLAVLIGWAIGRMDETPKPPAASPGSFESGAVPGNAAPRPAQGGGPQGGGAPGAARELSQWTTYDAAMDESRRTGKPVMLDFNAEWCGPCQAMKREVFDDYSRGEVVRALVIPVSITDRSREEGRNSSQIEDLQQRYQVDAFPTLVVFSPATGRMQQTKGFGAGDATLEWIKAATQSVK